MEGDRSHILAVPSAEAVAHRITDWRCEVGANEREETARLCSPWIGSSS